MSDELRRRVTTPDGPYRQTGRTQRMIESVIQDIEDGRCCFIVTPTMSMGLHTIKPRLMNEAKSRGMQVSKRTSDSIYLNDRIVKFVTADRIGVARKGIKDFAEHWDHSCREV